MKKRNISIVVLYTSNGKILLQERKGISKFGEEWTFFGGKIEDGETPLDAVIREIKEELNFDLINPIHISSESTITKNINNEEVNLFGEIYVKKIDEDKNIFTLEEGSNMAFFDIKEAKKLKLGPLDHKIIRIFENYRKNDTNNRTTFLS